MNKRIFLGVFFLLAVAITIYPPAGSTAPNGRTWLFNPWYPIRWERVLIELMAAAAIAGVVGVLASLVATANTSSNR